MRFLTALRHGLRRTHRHLGLVVIAWLATLLPAFLLSSVFLPDLGDNLDHSLFAERAIADNGFGLWTDLTEAPTSNLEPLQQSLPLRALFVLLLQILVSAGIVQTLLGTARRDQHPFLVGIGRNGWRFLRSAVWFLLAAGVLVAILGAAFPAVWELGAEQRNGAVQLYGFLIVAGLGLLAFAPLDLAYDLSRVAAAAHGDGRTFVGFFRALGHVLKRPFILLPLYFTFLLLGAALALGAFALRDGWVVGSAGAALALLALQQMLLLGRAYLRVGLWGSEIAYYQAIGEPRWCGRKDKPAPPTAPVKKSSSQPATQPIVPTTAAAGPTAAPVVAGAVATAAAGAPQAAEAVAGESEASTPAQESEREAREESAAEDDGTFQETTMRILPVDLSESQDKAQAAGEATSLPAESPTLALDAGEIAAHLEADDADDEDK